MIDWARLAAFIDGEGHIRCVAKTQKVKGKVYLHDYIEVGVSNTDPRLALWLTGKFGGSIQNIAAQNSRCRKGFYWVVGAAQAADVLRGAMEYFILKKDQADLAMAFYATMKRRGVKGTPQSVRDERAALKNKLRSLTARGPKKIEAAG